MNEILVPVIAGLFMFVGALLAFLGTRGKTKADAKAAMDARIDERVGDELARMYQRQDDTERQLVETRRRLTSAERRLAEAELHRELSDRQTLEMISHIVRLESMVPNPPGPPARPNWKIPLLTERPKPAE